MTLTLRLQTEMRSIARKLGIVRAITCVRSSLTGRAGRDKYEARFRDAMERAVRAGDVVWDVGANVGLYSELFATLVGRDGLVCAFEPAPACFEALRRRLAPFPQTKALNFALGDSDGELPFGLASNPLAATHSFAAGGNRTLVRVAKADSLLAADEAPVPNVVKIDVEGYEDEVLRGASEVLRRPALRAVFIEVHFAILEGRGRRHAPATIVERLRSNGFSTRWVDASHLCAAR